MLNKAILQGRICRDLELKMTASNIEVCSFTLAVERNYAKQGEKRQSDFINIVAYRQTAKFLCNYFSKGSPVLISGSIQTRTWDDANGQRRYATEVVADEVNFCGDKAQGQADNMPDGFAEVQSDDDLPF